MNLAERIAAKQKAARELALQKQKAKEAKRRAEYERMMAQPIPFESIVESIESRFEKYPKNNAVTIKVPTYQRGWMPDEYTHVGEMPIPWVDPLTDLLESFGFRVILHKDWGNTWILEIKLPM